MSTTTPPPPPVLVARPLPWDLINSRLVQNLTHQGLRDAGLIPTSKSLSTGLTVSLDANGTKFSAATLWISGPNKTLTANPGSLYPPATGTNIKMLVKICPESTVFKTNLPYTQWMDGNEAVKSETIVFSCLAKDQKKAEKTLKKLRALEFSFRWAVTAAKNVTMSRIILQLVPVPFKSLDDITDSYSPNLKVVNYPLEISEWTTVPSTYYQMMGPLPAILDLRSTDSSDMGILPSSWEIKNYVRFFCMNLTYNASLSVEEVTEMGSDYSKTFRVTPPPVAWPDLVPEPLIDDDDEFDYVPPSPPRVAQTGQNQPFSFESMSNPMQGQNYGFNPNPTGPAQLYPGQSQAFTFGMSDNTGQAHNFGVSQGMLFCCRAEFGCDTFSFIPYSVRFRFAGSNNSITKWQCSIQSYHAKQFEFILN